MDCKCYATKLLSHFAGLCYGTKFDTKYSWTVSPRNHHETFRGYKDTDLFFDDNLRHWRLQLISNSSIYALTNSTDYPFGVMKWIIYNDPCYDEPTHTTMLSISTCSKDEFTCGDGDCISMDDRCNGRVECDDKTGMK